MLGARKGAFPFFLGSFFPFLSGQRLPVSPLFSINFVSPCSPLSFDCCYRWNRCGAPSCEDLFLLPLCLLAQAVGILFFCAEPTNFWVPVGHRWSAGAGSQSDPCGSGSVPQAGERSWAAAGARGLCHQCWQHLTTQQSPGTVSPAGVQGKEALEKCSKSWLSVEPPF